MGERKGVNKYYPPDFDYKKHGSLDRYHNSHPLRERARKLKSEGILIIRFEMPYNIWCNGCNKHIGMGVRYNAEKKKVGNYYSTIIYKFRMKCHLCPQYFEIQTDPANCDYAILSGARRKEERWDAKANEQIEMTDHQDKKQLMTDPMFKLEHGVKDKQKLHTVIPTLNEIKDMQEAKKEDYLLNKALRKVFREQKKKIDKAKESDKRLLIKSSLDIPLLEETEEDKKLSKLMKYSTVQTSDKNQDAVRRKIINESIFSSSSDSKLQNHKSAKFADSNLTSMSLGIKVGKKRTLSESAGCSKQLKSELLQGKADNYFSASITSKHKSASESVVSITTARRDSSVGVDDDMYDSKSFCDEQNINSSNNLIVANYSSSSSGEESEI